MATNTKQVNFSEFFGGKGPSDFIYEDEQLEVYINSHLGSNKGSPKIKMDEVGRTRLKIFSDAAEAQIVTCRDVVVKLRDNKITNEEARIAANKLKATNDRFISEMYNYYKLVQSPSADEVSQYTSLQMQAEEIVAEIEVRAQLQKQDCTIATTSNNVNAPMTSRLPQMELARFDGDVLKWHQFWDQFSSNVDSRNINEVDKLLYLQSVLEGEAKQSIDGLDTTSKNYQIAVETLKERYGKPGVIVDAHYVALYRIKTAGDTAKECRTVLNEVERHLRVLKSLGEDVNHNHLRVMIMEKFPEDIIYELRMKLNTKDDIDTIRKNLEIIISAKESSIRMKNTKAEDNSTKFTTEALHVQTDDNKNRSFNNNRYQRGRQNFLNKENKGFEKRKFEKPNNRKRHFEGDRTNKQEGPARKRTKIKCFFCGEEHYNDECTNFKSLQERRSKLTGLCYNCFSNKHKINNCPSKRKCRHCSKYKQHNRALCPDKFSESKTTEDTKAMNVNIENTTTILQTCTVHVYKNGDRSKYIKCRILLDCGSQRSYITTKVTKELQLPVLEENRLSVFTFGARTPQEIESPVVNFDIVTHTNISKTIYANVVPHITGSVKYPFSYIQNIKDNLSRQNIILADDGSRKDEVDILLGNDYYYSFMSNQKKEIGNDLYIINTDFGWIVSGRCPVLREERDRLSVLTYFQSSREQSHFYEPDLPLRNDNLKQLWDLESIGITDSPKSTRDEEAVKNFNETTEYINQRYYVKWPWTEYPPTSLPVNLGLAYGRLTNLLKRLEPNVVKAYDDLLQEQLRQGIIEVVDESVLPDDHPIHYLPHHCVIQEGKSTKLRIVYDASAKTKNYSSLNECLYRGPLMLEDLTGLLINFRKHAIGVVADVEKAFLQIGLQKYDRDVTRFLWIKDVTKGATSENICHYRFCRVPFGVISSPFLLNATIKYHLEKSEFGINRQIASDIYVDNMITGVQTPEEAQALYKATKEVFSELSMNLRQWNSNSNKFKENIPEKDRDEHDAIKVLGVEWDTNTDTLKLKPNYERAKDMYTKRGVLKVTASIYDPCGFVAPIVLPAKLLLQELWKEKLEWDKPLPKELADKWQKVQSVLETIDQFSIPRTITDSAMQHREIDVQYELHCFADASMRAYAAVVYLRNSNKIGTKNTVSFVMGKSRLAPIKDQKELQIPRLELLSAVIGNRLIKFVEKFLRKNIHKQFLWLDSEIVISWYKSDKLLQPFVARRISELKANHCLQVRYVPTQLNPADCATRPVNTEVNNDYWLTGPEFLRMSPDNWPKSTRETHFYAQISSMREGLPNANIIGSEGKHSSTTANNDNEYQDLTMDEEMTETKDKEKDKEANENSVTEENIENEIEAILKVQRDRFPKEMQGTKTDLTRSLNLYKDENGLLRCGGRFENTNWPEDKKHPILLPYNSDFTNKIIEDIHKSNYHVGVGQTLAMTRNKYWILKGRSQVQKVLRNCLQCRKYGGGPYRLPEMPSLPSERVHYSVPFTYIGMDYFGPLRVEENGNTEKRWVCLFTCLAVRAIHMEVVKDLSAEECVMAIRRFVATRALPQLIISDNATQFKLTAEVMTSDYCIKNKITWRFIPELAPWFGGFYERLIGIVKNCLKRTLEKHLINQNQLCTVIKEIETVVNNRPLTTVGKEIEHILTPADFLRCCALPEISDKDFLEKATITKDNLIDSWKRGQMILKEYIKMFTTQYLTSLRERKSVHKQSRVVENRIPKIGDLVQIKSDQSRAHWKVGRITELVKGLDGQIRVAKVTMPNKETLTRSIGHLYPLEMETETPMFEQPCDKLPETPAAVDKPQQSSVRGSSRPAAQRARERVKQWTSQLTNLIYKKQ